MFVDTSIEKAVYRYKAETVAPFIGLVIPTVVLALIAYGTILNPSALAGAVFLGMIFATLAIASAIDYVHNQRIGRVYFYEDKIVHVSGNQSRDFDYSQVGTIGSANGNTIMRGYTATLTSKSYARRVRKFTLILDEKAIEIPNRLIQYYQFGMQTKTLLSTFINGKISLNRDTTKS